MRTFKITDPSVKIGMILDKYAKEKEARERKRVENLFIKGVAWSILLGVLAIVGVGTITLIKWMIGTW